MNEEEITENIYYKGICDCGEIIDVLLEKEKNQYVYRGSCKKCKEIFSIIVKDDEINQYLREGILYL